MAFDKLKAKQKAELEARQAQDAAQNPYVVDADGTVRRANAAPTPEQQFATENINNQDPSQFRPVLNPYSAADPREQFSSQAYGSNVELAQSLLGSVPGQDAYTIDPTYAQALGWDPSQQYQYETAEQQGHTNSLGLDAQKAALMGYGNIVNQGGLTDIDRASIMESTQMREQQLRSNREAIMANAAEQGRGGSLASMLSQNQAAQGTANMRAMDDARMRAMALGRKDAAIAGMDVVGGSIQTAQDAIDKFNTGARQDVQMRNASQANQGVDKRYADDQNVRNTNVNLANNAEIYNKSSSGGARGRFADHQDAADTVMNQRTNFAQDQRGIAEKIEAKKQQRINNIMAPVQMIAGATGEVVSGAVGKK